ncbi:DNA-directed RNA polymerase I [Sphaerosporella brunnea]|uniref:DNA-directed RNA polymerase I n=1 Tax=Sphaerosporella brunnea TaxID=1250544 RepID=A0A5J5ERQ9_9PEZI|nr:DNA-directed RNA polymerase I [Sphaerosporella brunnea]
MSSEYTNAGTVGDRSYGQPQQQSATMHYLCAECGVKVGINKGEPIRCKECGHRILYKQRTRRMVQFEAR